MPYHQSHKSILAAADQGYYICKIITKSDRWKALNLFLFKTSTWSLEALSGSLSGWFSLVIWIEKRSGEESESGSEEESATEEPDRLKECNKSIYEEVVKFMIPGQLWEFADTVEDWRPEAVAMRVVYRNSMMNIAAAAAAENSDSSFTARDSSTISPLLIETQWEGH